MRLHTNREVALKPPAGMTVTAEALTSPLTLVGLPRPSQDVFEHVSSKSAGTDKVDRQEYQHRPPLNMKKAAKHVGISLSTMYELLKRDGRRFDASFPPPLHLSEKRRAYPVEVLDAWLARKAAEAKERTK